MPPALQPPPEIITLEQYETLPESRRVEVFANVVYDMAIPLEILLMITSASYIIIKIMVCVRTGLQILGTKK